MNRIGQLENVRHTHTYTHAQSNRASRVPRCSSSLIHRRHTPRMSRSHWTMTTAMMIVNHTMRAWRQWPPPNAPLSSSSLSSSSLSSSSSSNQWHLFIVRCITVVDSESRDFVRRPSERYISLTVEVLNSSVFFVFSAVRCRLLLTTPTPHNRRSLCRHASFEGGANSKRNGAMRAAKHHSSTCLIFLAHSVIAQTRS